VAHHGSGHHRTVPLRFTAAAEQLVAKPEPATTCPVGLGDAVGESAFRWLEVIGFCVGPLMSLVQNRL
jgi:hypothetical protein